MHSDEQPFPLPPQPDPPLQIPPGYIILTLAGRDYVIPELFIRSTRHAVGAIEAAEAVGSLNSDVSNRSRLSYLLIWPVPVC
jgi:hypothetical protein